MWHPVKADILQATIIAERLPSITLHRSCRFCQFQHNNITVSKHLTVLVRVSKLFWRCAVTRLYTSRRSQAAFPTKYSKARFHCLQQAIRPTKLTMFMLACVCSCLLRDWRDDETGTVHRSDLTRMTTHAAPLQQRNCDMNMKNIWTKPKHRV